jgi:hypothetical protein
MLTSAALVGSIGCNVMTRPLDLTLDRISRGAAASMRVPRLCGIMASASRELTVGRISPGALERMGG